MNECGKVLSLAAVLAALGLAALIAIAQSKTGSRIRLKDLRAAYEGLAPEDC